jgi:hypothetical protein
MRVKHGEARRSGSSPEYRAWHHMLERCHNKDHPKYHRYGGRGITVDQRWLGESGFKNFLMDMGRRPGPSYSLERKKNGEGYSKDNCCWATRLEQQNNTDSNRILTFNGQSLSVSAWARSLQMKKETLNYRLRNGWTVEETLSTPRGAPTGSASHRYPHRQLQRDPKTGRLIAGAGKEG